jgi:hypothetical protein
MLGIVDRNGALSLPYGYRRIAAIDSPRLEMARRNGSQAQHGALGNMDSRCDRGAGADPRITLSGGHSLLLALESHPALSTPAAA